MTPLSSNYSKFDNDAIKGGTDQVGDSKIHNHFFRKQFNFLWQNGTGSKNKQAVWLPCQLKMIGWVGN